MSADSGKKKLGIVRTLGAMVSRATLAARAGLQFGGARNLYTVFGYKTVLTEADFRTKYIRQDIASRIVDAPPGATWSNPPTMKADPALKDAWDKLVKKNGLWMAMQKADRLARLGHYSIIVFGFDDTGLLDKPASNIKELLYTKNIGSGRIDNITLSNNVKDPRFGLPNTYNVMFQSVIDSNSTATSIGLTPIGAGKVVGDNKPVHYTRTVHVVDNPLEDTIIGVPIIEKCFNLLDDLLKVAGGTAETYWLASNRGMQADIDKDMELDPEDAAALSDEIEEYQHELRRIIKTRGVKINSLGGVTPSPKQTFDMIMSLLSGTTGIPRRILLGSEAGQLASEQDRANWAERIDERRTLFAEPIILNPTVTTLQNAGLLPEGEWEWEWPSAFIMSPLENSMVMAQTARAIGNISRQTGNKKPMQLTTVEEGRNLIGLEGDLPESKTFDLEEDNSPQQTVPPEEEETSQE